MVGVDTIQVRYGMGGLDTVQVLFDTVQFQFGMVCIGTVRVVPGQIVTGRNNTDTVQYGTFRVRMAQ